ncbi:hypothetical protein [Streptomyces iconiensis]|uniref:Uncharacterized protein n=1 Tax=Streptomyces iconiensis TaxID=1384038 RepID=A0ABT7A2A6_9ACTN|nr:hypothetical protein [Streptomyces iconiensis]MDJ1135449.1 hypothetical protein [Streptomyces iconiensis]
MSTSQAQDGRGAGEQRRCDAGEDAVRGRARTGAQVVATAGDAPALGAVSPLGAPAGEEDALVQQTVAALSEAGNGA